MLSLKMTVTNERPKRDTLLTSSTPGRLAMAISTG